MGKKTKIDWCDSTWNPVTGCLRGCEYCYARRIAERFRAKEFSGAYTVNEEENVPRTNYELKEPVKRCCTDAKGLHVYEKAPYPFGFVPTFHRYRLDDPKHWTKPKNIFGCSMADLFGEWVPDEWIKEVLKACEAAPWHRYLFLLELSSQVQQRIEENLKRGLPAEAFARSTVEFGNEGCYLSLAEVLHINRLGTVFTD